MTATTIHKYTLPDIPAPKVIASEAQHDEYVSTLLELEQRPKLTARERGYAELLTLLIEAYEEKHHAIPEASPVEVLGELISSNNLRQKDLIPVFGTESIVSEVLSGKRQLTRQHIERLSERFNVSPAVFF